MGKEEIGVEDGGNETIYKMSRRDILYIGE